MVSMIEDDIEDVPLAERRRLLASSKNYAGGDAASAAASAGANVTVPAAAAGDSDDEPLFARKGQKGNGGANPAQQTREADPDSSDSSEPESEAEELTASNAKPAKRRRGADSDSSDESALLRGACRVWSYEFVIAYHNHFYNKNDEDNCCWRFSEVVADKDTFTVLRKALKKPRALKSDPSIKFHVEKEDEKHFYIMFDILLGECW
jgi:hypothetical protein